MQRPGPDHDIAAARTLASDLGLGPTQPIVLKLAHHTTLRLAPWPIVARVQSSEPTRAVAAAMGRELALARYLADAGAPVAAPIEGPAAGPHMVGDCAVTLWAYVEHRPARGRADALAAARSLGRVHQALRGFPGRLPPFTDNIDRCGALLDDLAAMPMIAPDDRGFLRDRFAILRARLAAASFASIPLHGDTHLGNVMIAADGPVWGDLETACLGPLEWDLAPLAPAARRLFGEVDPSLVELLDQLRSLTVAVWCWADAARSAEVKAAAVYHLNWLRRRAAAAPRDAGQG